MEESIWTGLGKVRAREDGEGLVIEVDGLTSQAKYYKPLIYEFFRKEWRGARTLPRRVHTSPMLSGRSRPAPPCRRPGPP